MNKARVRIKDLALLAYWNDHTGFGRTAIVVPGIPYETSLDPMTSFLVDLGFGVIQPQFIGTFDSAGKFSPSNCIETLLQLEPILRNQKTLFDLRQEREFAVSGKIDVITGHSFGTYAVIGAILRGLTVGNAVLLSPMLEFGTHRRAAGIRVDMERHVRHISRALPLTFRMDSVRRWQKFFTTDTEFHPQPEKTKCKQQTRVLAIAGSADSSLEIQLSKKYVCEFAQRYSRCVKLIEYMQIEGGTHDVNSLLTAPAKEYLDKMLGTSQVQQG